MKDDTYQQILYLKSFIGEKKLKQIGVLHCNSCPVPSQITYPPFIIENKNETEEQIEVQSFEELLDTLFLRYSPTTLVYKDKPSNLPEVVPHPIFCCPECGKNYAVLEVDTYEPLPVMLSDVEVDALKGIFVDHFL